MEKFGMWELIASNKRKSAILFVIMGVILMALCVLFGKYYFPETGLVAFIMFGIMFWAVYAAIAYFSGSSILLALSHAKEVTPEIHPRLFNVVSEMKLAASLPSMPKIYIIDEPSANAFATGRDLNNCAIAVTAGLLEKLDRDELQGVIAHEMSHILNRDILYMTFAGVTVGSISLLSYWFLRTLRFSGGGSRRYRSKSSSGGGQLQLILLIVSILGAILGPIMAQILYYSISRKREFLADATAVRLTRYPEGLARALEKLVEDGATIPKVNAVTAPMYIVNPISSDSAQFSSVGRTHPPIDERVKILRSMISGAGYNDYQQAFFKVMGNGKSLIPKSSLKESKSVGLRQASKSRDKSTSGKRELGDLLKAVNDYLFLTCVCGLKIKVPPDAKEKAIECPRCKRSVHIPVAQIASVAGALSGTDKLAGMAKTRPDEITAPDTLEFERKGSGWQTFTCACGKLHNISPRFSAPKFTCKGCGRTIKVAA